MLSDEAPHSGTETVCYLGATVTVSLFTGTGKGGDALGDTYVAIENLTGSAFGDVLQGNASNNVLTGGDGNNGLVGLGGNDTILGGNGNDTISGGAGADALDGGTNVNFPNSVSVTAGVAINLDGVTLGVGGDAAGDTHKNFQIIYLTNQNDSVTGTAIDEWFRGLGGADAINGAGGTDTVSYYGSGAVTVGLDGTAGSGNEAQGDVLTNVEILQGTQFDDTLWGNSGAHTIYGMEGNDILRGDAGADVLDGGAGTDSVSFANSAAAITASFATGSLVVTASDAVGDSYTSIEGVVGSAFADTLRGGAAVELLDGGLGDDTLDGGAGTDTVTYANSSLGVAANLADSAFNTNEAAGDTYSGIENLIGSAFNDRLTGDGGNNVLDGGVGNDRLAGGAGADSLIGGAGTDIADYSQAGGAVALLLGGGGAGTGTVSAGDAAGDTLSGIESVIGSSFADSFALTLGAGFSVDGGAGSDTVALAANAGTVSSAQLASVLSRVETIDFTASGTNASLTVDSSFIQGVVGAGNASHLTVDFNAGDTLQIANGSFYTQNGNDYTFYSDSSLTTTVAQLTVV